MIPWDVNLLIVRVFLSDNAQWSVDVNNCERY